MKLPTEMESIENEVMLKYKEVVFDSEWGDWSMKSSIFDHCIFGKDNLMFLIECENELKVGGYLFEKINSINHSIEDRNAFIFCFKQNEMKLFKIQNNIGTLILRHLINVFLEEKD